MSEFPEGDAGLVPPLPHDHVFGGEFFTDTEFTADQAACAPAMDTQVDDEKTNYYQDPMIGFELPPSDAMDDVQSLQ